MGTNNQLIDKEGPEHHVNPMITKASHKQMIALTLLAMRLHRADISRQKHDVYS